jgi:hypothetical protein
VTYVSNNETVVDSFTIKADISNGNESFAISTNTDIVDTPEPIVPLD